MSEIYAPLDPETLQDPLIAFERLRELGRGTWIDSLRSFVYVDYASCKQALINSDLFAKDPRRVGVKLSPHQLSIQTEDPPNTLGFRHDVIRCIRSLPSNAITSAAASTMLGQVNNLSDITTVDIVQALCIPAATTITAGVLGIEEAEVRRYIPHYVPLVKAMDSGVEPERLEPGRQAGRALQSLAREWIRGATQEGRVVALGQSSIHDYPEGYVINTIAGVLNASFSTTLSITSQVILRLVTDRDTRTQLHDLCSRDQLRIAANELLRYFSPAQATSRRVIVPQKLGDEQLKPGDTVILLLAAANRDPLQFPNPNIIDLKRSPNAHLAFAAGSHRCLGSTLAEQWLIELLAILKSTPLLDQFSEIIDIHYLETATLRTLHSAMLAQTGDDNERS